MPPTDGVSSVAVSCCGGSGAGVLFATRGLALFALAEGSALPGFDADAGASGDFLAGVVGTGALAAGTSGTAGGAVSVTGAGGGGEASCALWLVCDPRHAIYPS